MYRVTLVRPGIGATSIVAAESPLMLTNRVYVRARAWSYPESCEVVNRALRGVATLDRRRRLAVLPGVWRLPEASS